MLPILHVSGLILVYNGHLVMIIVTTTSILPGTPTMSPLAEDLRKVASKDDEQGPNSAQLHPLEKLDNKYETSR
ncbi:hypothetical protein BT63DRAFT_424145 [Microthyrium microscopicum]|uniref:Uncharacterized protein n=1 Tax=Microthyrium microscopicum TaxID=703497 RepID=A0A6A6UGI5_9PEZI|nr:hypothetical protein BT63DRAFT_424145 [Microthyrium microscopicum]